MYRARAGCCCDVCYRHVVDASRLLPTYICRRCPDPRLCISTNACCNAAPRVYVYAPVFARLHRGPGCPDDILVARSRSLPLAPSLSLSHSLSYTLSRYSSASRVAFVAIVSHSHMPSRILEQQEILTRISALVEGEYVSYRSFFEVCCNVGLTFFHFLLN